MKKLVVVLIAMLALVTLFREAAPSSSANREAVVAGMSLVP